MVADQKFGDTITHIDSKRRFGMVPSVQRPKAKPDTNRFVEIARKQLVRQMTDTEKLVLAMTTSVNQ